MAPHPWHEVSNFKTAESIAASATMLTPRYDSMYAPGDAERAASGVYVDEFCVYEPRAPSSTHTGHRVQPRYVIEFDVVHSST